jgi:hypothetical protein
VRQSCSSCRLLLLMLPNHFPCILLPNCNSGTALHSNFGGRAAYCACWDICVSAIVLIHVALFCYVIVNSYKSVHCINSW